MSSTQPDSLQFLKDGNLSEALEQLQQQVRGNPSDARLRVFLFQLLSVLGQWERALTQLSVAGDLDAGTLAMVQAYREAIRCEVLRAEIFQGKRSPLILGEPEPWLARMVEALKLSAEGQDSQAEELRAHALEEADTTPGTITLDSKRDEETSPRPFNWIADADSRLGPVLEGVVNGRYYWIPFSHIHQIHIDPPEDLRDMVWTPVHFRWANGGETVGMVPTRYAATEDVSDDLLRLARKTEWLSSGTASYHGLGQRLFATDSDEYSLLDARLITLETLVPGAENAESA